MNDMAPKPDRLVLPRDTFRSQRASTSSGPTPVVVTPHYDDRPVTESPGRIARSEQFEDTRQVSPETPVAERRPARSPRDKAALARNPFEGYGERSSARPYALRLPDAIDLALRQLAAEERTHPLRVIDRILHDHLKKTGKLPPPQNR